MVCCFQVGQSATVVAMEQEVTTMELLKKQETTTNLTARIAEISAEV